MKSSGGWLHNNGIVLNITEWSIKKWFRWHILCCVYCTTMKNFKKGTEKEMPLSFCVPGITTENPLSHMI